MIRAFFYASTQTNPTEAMTRRTLCYIQGGIMKARYVARRCQNVEQ
jgi:hypothetical protein